MGKIGLILPLLIILGTWSAVSYQTGELQEFSGTLTSLVLGLTTGLGAVEGVDRFKNARNQKEK